MRYGRQTEWVGSSERPCRAQGAYALHHRTGNALQFETICGLTLRVSDAPAPDTAAFDVGVRPESIEVLPYQPLERLPGRYVVAGTVRETVLLARLGRYCSNRQAGDRSKVYNRIGLTSLALMASPLLPVSPTQNAFLYQRRHPECKVTTPRVVRRSS
jgi:hypothetical protein